MEPEDILYYIKAMVKTFMAYGNYENRAKARTRYMQDTLGKEGYIEAYGEKLREVMDEEKDNLKIKKEELISFHPEEKARERQPPARSCRIGQGRL